ncbi:uncharacterized protein LOC110263583 [Arachis ipaensis]|uniref:uncharacterized protein LOC110263583 n=1 Tax=Arachis ipaensis TaxID=130454 RepID=UPI000A2B42FA|nr:uncharacterized protein LOC110263583 [Arachis ipaensis]
MEAVGQYMQVIATRMLCIGCTTKLLGAGEKEYVGKIVLLEKIAAQKEKELTGRDTLIAENTKKMKDQEEEVETFRGQIWDLQSQMSQADIEKGKMVARVRELEVEVMEMFAVGFDRFIAKSLFSLQNLMFQNWM